MNEQLINNRYRIVRSIGKGGFGETFLVEDTQLPSGRYCVLKQLIPVEGDEQTYQLVKDRFQREAAILEDLGEGHGQVPRLYAYFSEADKFYLAQEYIEGQTLFNCVEAQGIFSEARVRELLVSILPVLEYVHSKQIVHRDIKPDNIMIRHADQKPVLIDFGAVRETMGTVYTNSGKSSRSIVIGTPGFMPSEQAVGRPTFASDIYSLGLTIIFLITHKFPQELPTDPATGTIVWRNLAPAVSPSLAQILDQAIHPHARDRFQTARQMLDALRTHSSAAMASINGVPPTAPSPVMPTITSPAVPPANGAPMQPATVVSATPAPVNTASAKSGMNDWTKAMLMGSLIGAFILGGLYITRPEASSSQDTTTADAATEVENTTADSTTASSADDVAEVPPATQQAIPPQTPAQQTPSSENQGMPSPTPDPVPPAPNSGGNAPQSINQEQAINLVNAWLEGKQVMMAPPYSYQTADMLTTGILLNDITKPGGSIDWLRNNNARYQFGVQRTEGVERFAANGQNATIELWVTEDRTLYINGRVDQSQSDFRTRLITYDLRLIDGRWKIADYRVGAER